MIKRSYLFALVIALLYVSVANAQYPIADAIANKVAQKYQISSCEQFSSHNGVLRNDRGDERTLAGQMNEELAPHGLEFIKAKNDRAGGAQLIYTMLQHYQLKIAHTCTNTIEALERRLALHRPHRPRRS
jgi:hypothetical protein